MKSDSYFVHFNPKTEGKLRLFCFHYAGGGASAFFDWHKYLQNYVEVIGVQLPGRETRFSEPLAKDISSVVNDLGDSFKDAINKPCIFFGHSLGALIAIEVAKELKSRNFRGPSRIIVSGRSAPQDKNKYYDKITHLPDDEFLAKLPEYGGVPEGVLENKDLIDIYLPILRSDFFLSETTKVHPDRKLSCPISVFGGLEDRVSEKNLNLWRFETSYSCDVNMFDGNHFFIKSNAKVVIKKISQIINSELSKGVHSYTKAINF